MHRGDDDDHDDYDDSENAFRRNFVVGENNGRSLKPILLTATRIQKLVICGSLAHYRHFRCSRITVTLLFCCENKRAGGKHEENSTCVMV